MKKTLILPCLIIVLSAAALAATTFTPRLTINEEYTDNVDLTPNNEQSEWITSISPGATLEFAGRTAGLSLAYDPSYVMYNRFSENNTWRHNGNVGLWADLTRRTHFEANNAFLYTEDPVTESDTTIRRGREQYLVNTTSVGLTQQFGPENSIDLGYEYSFLDNESGLVEDTQRHEPSAVLTYWFIPNNWATQVGATYRKGLYEIAPDFDYWHADFRIIRRLTRHLDGYLRYGYSEMQYEGETENYLIHETGPGIHYAIGETTDISLEITYFVRNFESKEDENKFIGIASIAHTWVMPRSSINVTASSGYKPDTFGAENIGFSYYTEINSRVEYSFTRRLSGDIFGGYRYVNNVDLEPERDDNTYNAGTGLSLNLLDWAILRVLYTYRTVESDSDKDEYTENRVMLSLTMTPATPFRLGD
jgi:hypothetical protein